MLIDCYYTLMNCRPGSAGNIPAVAHNFTLVVLAIVVVSVLPVVWEIWQVRPRAKFGAYANCTGESRS